MHVPVRQPDRQSRCSFIPGKSGSEKFDVGGFNELGSAASPPAGPLEGSGGGPPGLPLPGSVHIVSLYDGG